MRNFHRFLSKIKFTDTCWLWTGTTDSYGYGVFWLKNKTKKAHRLSYINFNGPIPKGLDIHHLCEVKHCVNPDHMMLIKRAVHQRLTRGQYMRNGEWYCKRGHRLIYNITTAENGSCLECKKVWYQENQSPEREVIDGSARDRSS